MAKLNTQQKVRIQQKKALVKGEKARVITHLGYAVLLEYQSRALLADWRKNLGEIVCNDNVLISFSGENAVIEAILERGKTFNKRQGRKTRPIASNIEQILLVLAIEPEWQENLLERFLIAAAADDLPLAVFVNKTDLLYEHTDLLQRLSPYQSLVKFMFGSINKRENLQDLERFLANKQTLICGQSGVGKSSLIKYFNPEAEVWIQTISEISRLGKHTTTNLRLYPQKTSAIIDTPGIRGLAIEHYEPQKVLAVFPEIRDCVCKFADCTHINEPQCGVLEALNSGAINQTRYRNFQQIMREIHEFRALQKAR